MTSFKLALCSALLVSATFAMAAPQANIDTLNADKRVITFSPVTTQGYMIYNIGLSVLLKKVDISALPLPDDKLAAIQAFLDSYEVANVVVPAKPSYNGSLKFDVTSTESGKGIGSYAFEQHNKNGVVTLRVIATPFHGIPMSPEITEAMEYLSEVVAFESLN